MVRVLSDPKSGGKPRRPLGYVDAKELKRRFEEGKADGVRRDLPFATLPILEPVFRLDLSAYL
jgi:hypothetical protein